MEYLRVAQDLEMYGIQYYPICNNKETDLTLGVSAQGIGIYKETNRITPRPFFSWSEIKNISFKNKVVSFRISFAKVFYRSIIRNSKLALILSFLQSSSFQYHYK
ncbi:unnamed protein product [Gongylonema pulchrum]|uniref:FERM domain-containing protein n=1 Tax=Gongylonema pulchrum TaxID=637853 RepID=A0A183DIS3_9BILA|nr:unnamed protein product [Gongylonema pulchrum]